MDWSFQERFVFDLETKKSHLSSGRRSDLSCGSKMGEMVFAQAVVLAVASATFSMCPRNLVDCRRILRRTVEIITISNGSSGAR